VRWVFVVARRNADARAGLKRDACLAIHCALWECPDAGRFPEPTGDRCGYNCVDYELMDNWVLAEKRQGLFAIDPLR
jgi:hypothetical protein